MQPFRINTTATPSHTQEQAASSSSATQPQSIVHALANQIRQAAGPNFQNTLGDMQRITDHVSAKNKRHQDFQTALLLWVSVLPNAEKENAAKIAKRLLNAPPDRKTHTLEFTQQVVPNFVAFFPQLENLDLSILTEELPLFIGQAQNLKTLTIRAEHINKLPDNMGDLRKLTTLTLKQCHLIHDLPTTMGTLPKLTRLNITSSHANNPLPSNIDQLRNLKIVYLSNCHTMGNTLTQLEKIAGIRRLYLYNTPVYSNDLQRIHALKGLKSLEVSSCSTLEHIPEGLCTLQHLNELLLMHCDALLALPESIGQLKNLRKLNITTCTALTTLPESIGELQMLRELNVFQSSRLNSLPGSIIELPSHCTIDVSGTGLSANVLENLSRQTEIIRQQSNGARGPHVDFSLPASITAPVGSLAEETLKWFNEASQADPLPAAIHTIEQLAPPMANALATLLARFRKTAQYIQAPTNTAQRIHRLLSTLIKYPSLLESCCAMAVESITNCDDRTALGLLQIELALFEYALILFVRHPNNTPRAYGTAHNLAKSIFKQKQLMDIAHQHAKQAKGFVDETEIVLKYVTHLGKELKLPAKLDYMLHERTAWQVKPEHLQNAKLSIEHSDNLDNAAFLNFLAAWHPWQETVKQQDPLAYEHIKTQQTRTDALYERALKAKLEEYTHACAVEPNGELSTKALNTLAEVNQIREQREHDRLAAWHPHIHAALKHTPAESSTAQPNKRVRLG